jgi:hypothetical protein
MQVTFYFLCQMFRAKGMQESEYPTRRLAVVLVHDHFTLSSGILFHKVNRDSRIARSIAIPAFVIVNIRLRRPPRSCVAPPTLDLT